MLLLLVAVVISIHFELHEIGELNKGGELGWGKEVSLIIVEAHLVNKASL